MKRCPCRHQPCACGERCLKGESCDHCTCTLPYTGDSPEGPTA